MISELMPIAVLDSFRGNNKPGKLNLSGLWFRNMKLSALVPLSSFQPNIKKFEYQFFDLGRGIGAGKILAKFLFRQGDVIFNGLFLLCHDTKHRILIQLSGLAKLS